jgi:hypothetical protein
MIKLDKVMQDFEMATSQLKELGTCITIFGSARTAKCFIKAKSSLSR